MTRYIVLVVAGMLCFLSRPDAQPAGYIVRGDTLISGVKIKYDAGSPEWVQVRFRKDDWESVSAETISEFGFKEDKGRVFRSFDELPPTGRGRVFMEQIQQGSLELYEFPAGKTRFYLYRKDLLPLERSTYLNQIQPLNAACPGREAQFRLVRYSKNSLSSFIDDHNQQRCGNIPFLKFGAFMDYGHQQLRLPESTFPIILPEGRTPTTWYLGLGAFIDQPLWGLSPFSLSGEMIFSKSTFLTEILTSAVHQDVSIEMSNLQFSLGPRYTFNTRKFRPYGWIGGTLNRSFNTNSELIQAKLEGSEVTIAHYESFLNFPELFYGFSYACGVEVFYHYRHFIALEIAGNRMVGQEKTQLTGNHLKLKINL